MSSNFLPSISSSVLLAIKKQKLPIIAMISLILLIVYLFATTNMNDMNITTKKGDNEPTALSLHRHAHKVKGCYVILIRNSELNGIFPIFEEFFI